jgi:hypothetical protein
VSPCRFLGGLLVGVLLLLLAPVPAEAQRCRYLDNRSECQELRQLERQTQELEDMRLDQQRRDLDRQREREQGQWEREQAREQERRDERARCSPGYHDYYGLGCF